MKFDAKKWLDVVKLVAPIILMLVPGGAALAPLAPLIINAISEAQQIPGASGPEKKAHVMALVETAITVTNSTAKKQVLNPQLTIAASSAAVDTIIATVNVVQDAHAAVVLPPPAAPSAA